MRLSLTSLLFAFLAVLLAVGGCAPTPPLRIGTNPWAGYLPLYYARDLGLIDERRLQLIEFDSSADVLGAFRNGAIDAAAVTLDEALSLADTQLQPRIVLVFDVSDGADTVLAQPDITTPEALRGRRIGVETNALGAYMLASFLKHSGLGPKDLQIVTLPVQEHERAFRQGKVDALITFDPARSHLLGTGAHELFSSRDIPGEIVDVLVVREETLLQHDRQLRALAAAYFDGLRHLREAPTVAADKLRRRSGLSAEALTAAWGLMTLADEATNRRLLSAAEGGLSSTIPRLERVMLDARLLSQPVSDRIRLDDRLMQRTP